jgi:predicted HAD superfamily Cof-like phosphohydrolase
MIDDIKAFHEKFGLEYDGPPRLLPKELGAFRLGFLFEELTEYAMAETREDKIDALVDLVYVALGTAYLHGFDWQTHWDEVQRANMSKVRTERPSDSKRGSSFDVVKPVGWIGPNHAQFLDSDE